MILYKSSPPIILFQFHNGISGVIVSFLTFFKKKQIGLFTHIGRVINPINHCSLPRTLAGEKLLTDADC